MNSFNLGYFYCMNFNRSGFIIIFLLMSFFGFGQLVDDFSDGNFTQSPTWQGDTQNFIVNDDLMLQLNAPDAGESFIYSSFDGADSLEWNFYFLLDFSPSGGNNLKIYFALDNADLTTASGYYLEIGEDGSDDAINFLRLDSGVSSSLASASMGAVAIDPAEARVQIKKSALGEWTVNVDYDGGIILSEELSFLETAYALTDPQFFGFYCTYTSTRSDKFFFDDIDVREPEQDVTPPTLVSAELITPDSIVLTYNELLHANSETLSNVGIDNGIGNPESILINSMSPNTLEVKFSQSLASGISYSICSMDIEDLSGNKSVSECRELFLVVSPEVGDIYINEILFNPPTGGSDFIELINTSDKFLSLEGVTIHNSQNGQFDPIVEGIVLLPQEILAFTKDPDFLINQYLPIDENQMIEQELPAFNADEGNVMIKVFNGIEEITLDSFDYSDELHFVLIDDVKGVSLEKLSPTGATNNNDSWHSASENVNFATPGYTNSSFQNPVNGGEELVFLPKKVFSPNGDGNDDLFPINFNLPNPGYISNIKIFTDRGFLVKQLASNMLLGTENIVYWDGITDEGILGDIGIYVILIELFDDQGNKSIVKKTCVLADFID